jgi:integrative and conjugative element protein (TIGR02256 family)
MPIVRPEVTLRLNVSAEAEAKLYELAQVSEDGLETGGILIGRGPSAHGLIDIVDVGDPGPEAIRRADAFLRDLQHAQRLADAAWSRNRATWIGEWHTHPRSGPQPSARDLLTYAEILTQSELDFAVFISIIITPGIDTDWTSLTLTPWLIGRTDVPQVVVVTRVQVLAFPKPREAGPDPPPETSRDG